MRIATTPLGILALLLAGIVILSSRGPWRAIRVHRFAGFCWVSLPGLGVVDSAIHLVAALTRLSRVAVAVLMSQPEPAPAAVRA